MNIAETFLVNLQAEFRNLHKMSRALTKELNTEIGVCKILENQPIFYTWLSC